MRLIQPAKLLDNLAENFVPPLINESETGKLSFSSDEFARWAQEWETQTGERLVRTGADSVEFYAVMAREQRRQFYCSNLGRLIGDLQDRFQPTDRFANFEFKQTREETVFFDRRERLASSPVQTFLELTAGDKRDKETADQVRKFILESCAR